MRTASVSTILLAFAGSQSHAYVVRPAAVSSPTKVGASRLSQLNAHTNNEKRPEANDDEILNNHLQDAASTMRRAAATALLTAALTFSPTMPDLQQQQRISGDVPTTAGFITPSTLVVRPQIASAADYGSLTDEQKAVAEAWRLVDNSYIERTFNNQDWFGIRQDAVKKKYKNMDEARSEIQSLVSSLGDKYTRYLPPAKYQSMVDAATGTLAGVGVEISTDNDGRIIASDVEANSPAVRGGVKPRDVFIEVDGTRFDDGKATPDDVASKLRGPEGSKVGVVMERDGKTLDYILTRQKITVTSVKTYMSDKSGVGKVGVIKIKSFSGTTADTVKKAVEDLKKKGANAFVLDVRNNPGGLLPGGIDTASLFLDASKPVVFEVNKNGFVKATETFAPGIELESPLVVLANGNTASAAEVMSAALKENGRAKLVGEQTFGKGIVQTIRQLSYDNGGVAITVQRYETPLHNDINKSGIPVDIVSKGCVSDDAVTCIPKEAFASR